MGWSWTHKPKGTTATEFLKGRSGALSWSEPCPATYTVLDTAIVSLKTFYAAVERVDKNTGAREVWAAVFLLGYAPKSEYNFGWKDMDETMGPCEATCPERILDLLTPTTNEYANDWRARCRAAIAARRDRPKIVVGSTLNLYGRPYTVENPSVYGKAGFRLKDSEGHIYFASHVKLRRATDIKSPP